MPDFFMIQIRGLSKSGCYSKAAPTEKQSVCDDDSPSKQLREQIMSCPNRGPWMRTMCQWWHGPNCGRRPLDGGYIMGGF